MENQVKPMGKMEAAAGKANGFIQRNWKKALKWAAIGLMLWFAVYQIMPIYIGYRMVADKVVEGTVEEYLEDERKEMEERVKDAEEKAEEAEEKAEELVDVTRNAATDARA